MGEKKIIKLLHLSPFHHLLLFSLFFVIIISPSLAANENPDLQKGKKELQGCRTEIKGKKKDIAKAGKKEKGLLTEIGKINKKLNTLGIEERKLDREIILLEKGLREKNAAISSLQLDIERKRRLLSKRLVFLYKNEDVSYLNRDVESSSPAAPMKIFNPSPIPPSPIPGGKGEINIIKFLLSSEGSTEADRRSRYMTRIAAHDRDLIKGYRRDVAKLSMQMEGIRADKEKLEGAEKELAKKRVEIKSEREERDRLLFKVRKEKQQYKESLKELESNARNLQQLLKRLERQASAPSRGTPLRGGVKGDIKGYPASGFELQKGLLDFPVNGEVVGFFGKEIDKASHTAVYRKGIEIKTQKGASIKAVYNGRVIFADQFKGFGLLMIIDHGGGYYTLYAHAAKFQKKLNDEINKGDIIGEIGDSGPSSESALYFEVRHGGKPENPLDWLKS